MRIRNANGYAYEHSFACDSAAAWHLSPSLKIPRETTYPNLVSSQQSAIRQTVRYLVPRAFTRPAGACFSKVPVSQRFGHPHSQIPSVLGIPFSYYCNVLGIPRYPPGMPKSLVLSPLQKNSGFRRKIENVLEMDSAKCRNLFQYLKKVYPEGFTKICQKVRVWLKIRVLVLRGQGEGWHSASTTCYHRGRESEGLRRVPLCSFFWTRRPR